MGDVSHSKGVVTQLQPGQLPMALRRPGLAGTNPGSCSAGTAMKPEGVYSPVHGMKQWGKISGHGEDSIPQQSGTAVSRNTACLQPGSERRRAALLAATPQGRGLTVGGAGEESMGTARRSKWGKIYTL